MAERSVGTAGFDLTLIRRGEITAVVAAIIILLGLLVLPWYNARNPSPVRVAGAPPALYAQSTTGVGPTEPSVPGGAAPAEFGAWSGQDALGTLANLVVLAAALGGIAVAAAGARGLELDGSGRRLLLLAIAAVVAILLRMVFRPSVVSNYEFDADLRFGIFITLGGALLLVWAAWMRHPSSPARGATEKLDPRS